MTTGLVERLGGSTRGATCFLATPAPLALPRLSEKDGAE